MGKKKKTASKPASEATTTEAKTKRPRRPVVVQIAERLQRSSEDCMTIAGWNIAELTEYGAKNLANELHQISMFLSAKHTEGWTPPATAKGRGPKFPEGSTVRMKAEFRGHYTNCTVEQLDSIEFLWLDPLDPKIAAVKIGDIQCSIRANRLELAVAPSGTARLEAAE